MKIVKKILCVCAAMLVSNVSLAAGTASGLVTQTLLGTAGILIFKVGTSATGQPSCSAGGEWALQLDTSAGKGTYALLLTAVAQGLTINVVGDGTCGVWGDRETVSYLYINP
jgi:hypothetical protein